MKKYLILTIGLSILLACGRKERKADPTVQVTALAQTTAAQPDEQRENGREKQQTVWKRSTADKQADYCMVRLTYTNGITPLKRYAYQSWYSEQLRLPVAVSWYLTGDHTHGNNKRKNQQFHPDTDVKNPVTTLDYMQSGYDRGHMCPAGDNKWNQQALDETFLMTNICPQNHNLNKNDWNDLEMLCRQWARKYGRIYIVCGPVLRGTQHKQIGPRQRRVTVPEAFYKVVLRTGKNAAAIGFVYDNKGSRQPMKQAVRTVDEIERLTGIDFFSALDNQTENRIEAQADLKDW